jgi:hypothetical protein
MLGAIANIPAIIGVSATQKADQIRSSSASAE